MNCLLGKLRLFFSRVPKNIDNQEKIVKVVFNPLNFNKKDELRANAYRCNNDDLSVNRLDFSTLDLCKCQGMMLEKKAQIKMPSKKFYGIALLFAKEIRDFASVFYRPVFGNKAHAEIVTGHNKSTGIGETNLAQYNMVTETLARNSRIFKDSDTAKKKWICDNANEILTLKYDN